MGYAFPEDALVYECLSSAVTAEGERPRGESLDCSSGLRWNLSNQCGQLVTVIAGGDDVIQTVPYWTDTPREPASCREQLPKQYAEDLASNLAEAQSQTITVSKTKKKGLFYVFADGQILVIDAVAGAIVKTIANPTVPFPNNCTGTPMAGSWGDSVFANNHMFSASYYRNATIGPDDGIYVINTQTQTLVQRVPSATRPVHVFYVPYLDEVWSHSDGTANFDVIDARNYSAVHEDVIAHVNISGHGKLVFNAALDSKAHASNVNEPGAFILDLETKASNGQLSFVNFTGQPISGGRVTICPGTHSLAYSKVNRHAYFECTSVRDPTNSSNILLYPGVVEIDTDDDTVVNQLPFTGHLATTPDEQFLTIVNGRERSVRIIEITPIGQPDLYFTIPLNETPGATPAFYPMSDHYVMAVPMLNTNKMAIIDFGLVLRCGANCTDPGQTVKYVDVGYQNPPGRPGALTTSRSVDAGHTFICTPAIYDQGIGCYNPINDTSIFIGGAANPIRNPARVYFAPGALAGAPENVNALFNCADAATTRGNYPTLAPVVNQTLIKSAAP
ncbi:hypothetical protein KFL_001230150 [Klebsormidium nitens]|uniref:Uncharacterized protein n=1 Tax=Klebsormidium nitens TaxID=105231 RepID=A0A1Y1I1Z5_KLENI|nr:hypothetical protein KFL_001230150 [Klebsormidium nitens]|eukprot:GAQ82767.1 hypothetical protein KFL_001230150 [Klebsormidium nitens]